MRFADRLFRFDRWPAAAAADNLAGRMSLQLIEVLHAHYRQRPTAPAALGSAGQLTYQQLGAAVQRIAYRLRNDFPDGGVVMLSFPNQPQYIAAFLGVLAAGYTLFPLPLDIAGPEMQAAIERSAARAIIVPSAHAAALGKMFPTTAALPELGEDAVLLTRPQPGPSLPEGPALLLQSSGTTGEPKIVRRDGRSLDAVSANMVRACGFRADDHVLAAVPLCHSYGLEHGLLAPIFAGSCVHLCQGFDLSIVLPALRERGITIFPGVPFMFDLLCRAAAVAFPSLRLAYSAGGPLPRTTFDQFHQKFGLRIGQIYGSSEVGSVTFSSPDDPHFDPSDVGKPMGDVSIRLLETASGPDQIAIRAPSMFSGYLHEDSPLIDGHFVTGDLGTIDAHGHLRITGRLKLLIDIGGRKVNPAEVEAVLRQHPGVRQCVVVPMRLSESVCRLKAVVTPAHPDLELSPRDLRQFARERLSPFKVPRQFEVRSALPTSPAGKVLRHRVESP